MNPIIKRIGTWWLSGPKYFFSKLLAGPEWNRPILDLVPELNACDSLEEVIDVFRDRAWWAPDPLFQLWDRVYPPSLMLKRQGDDCDGWAGLHAQAVEAALGHRGWKAMIASYLAEQWTLSHHFAIAVDPWGRHWAIQPRPQRVDNLPNVQMVFGPYDTPEQAIGDISSRYLTSPVWYDLRRADWSLLESVPKR